MRADTTLHLTAPGRGRCYRWRAQAAGERHRQAVTQLTIAAFHQLRQFQGRPGVSVAPEGEALELKLVRGDIEVRVLVPESVLEWFVEAEQLANGSRANDWSGQWQRAVPFVVPAA